MRTRDRLICFGEKKPALLVLLLLSLFWPASSAVQAMRIDEGGVARPAMPDRPDAPNAEVTLGNRVFQDLDNDGLYEPGSGETGIPLVLLNLYRDDGFTAGSLDVGDTLLSSGNTVGGGLYSFTGLADGDYLVEVDPLNFDPGGALVGLVSAYGNDPAPDPDDDVDGDDNGAAVAGFGVASGAITLASGTEPTADGDGDPDTNLTLDFGFTCELCLGDRIFEDLDDDGIFDDPTEVGLENVEVSLYRDADADGQRSAGDEFVASTTTDADGRYLFCGLGAGEYLVEVVPTNFQSGGVLEAYRSSAGNDPAPDPDDDVDGDDNGAVVGGFGVATQAATLVCGSEPDKNEDGDDTDSNLTIDLGFVPTLSLGDRIFRDVDFDGIYDTGNGDTGIAVVLVHLYEDTNADGVLSAGDTLLDSTTSLGDGSYRFSGLEPGDYLVQVDPVNFLPGGVLNGTLSSGANEVGGLAPDPDDDVDDDDNGYLVSGFGVATRAVTLDRGTEPSGDGDGDPNTNLTLDLGFVCNLCLGDQIFLDADNDGLFDDGVESGIESVTVNLYRDVDNDGLRSAGDVFVDSVETGPDGDYLFCELTAGDYVVEIDPAEFQAGGSLLGLVSSSGNDPAPDPDDDIDDDDNGAATLLSGELVVATRAVTLDCGLEPDKAVDGDGTDRNRTVDLGLTPAAPAIRIDKTVYQGHDGGASCPGGEVVVDVAGADVTYCFAVTNTGDTYLDAIAIDDLDLGIDETDLTILGSPSLPLAPGATARWFYESTLAGDLTNTADVSANPTDDAGNDLPGLDDPTDDDTAEVDEVAPSVRIEKTVYEGHDVGASCAGSELVSDFVGSPVTYCFVVTNTGDTYLGAIAIDDFDLGIDETDMTLLGIPSFPLAPNAEASWYYETTITGDLVNTAEVDANPTDDQGGDLPGIGNVGDDDSAEVDGIVPGTPSIQVTKTADQTTVYAGTLVVYTYAVENTGETVLAEIDATDDRCGPLVYVSGDAGDDGLMGIGEIWIYTCSATLSVDTTNTVEVFGTPSDDQGDPIPLLSPVSDTDIETVDVINPAIDLQKVAMPTQTTAGGLVTYSFFVSNPGDDPLRNVVVSDDTCSPVGLVSGDGNSNGQLDPGETWLYSCATTVADDTLNTADVTADDSLDNPVEDTDTAFVDVVFTGLDLEKSADATTVYTGTLVTYTYTVTNTGQDPLSNVVVTDDRCGPVVFDGGDANNNGELDLDETWTYLCSQTLTADTTNMALVTAEDPLGNPVPPDQAVETVDVIDPAIAVEKSVDPEVIEAGQPVVYSYLVTNPGDDPLANVSLADDTCSPVSGPQAGGDANNDGLLDPGETWIYACSASPTADTTNTVTASGDDSLGNPVEDTDTAFVDVVVPAIELIKTASESIVYPGTLVIYTLEATNVGDVALDSVVVSDDTCSPVTGPDPAGDANDNGLLDPGETWTYSCSAVIDQDVTNTGTVVANPVDDAGNDLPALADVSDSDTADVNVIDPAIELVKTADQPQVTPGTAVTWIFEATNIGDDPLSNVVVSDDTCSPVTGPDPAGDANNNGLLDPAETWTYSCSDVVDEDTVNVATATGDDSLGNPVTDDDTALVDAQDVGLAIVKSVDEPIIYAGELVVYSYEVTNVGADPATNVVVTDDRCSPVGFIGGDSNNNGRLEPSETWLYVCQTALLDDTVNVVTVTGEDLLGSPLDPDMDAASVNVINPAIRVVKTADPVVTTSGGVVTYGYEVTNPGDDPLANVSLSDDTCSPVNGPTSGDANNNGLLDPGELWRYDCTTTVASDTTNVVTVDADDSLGNPVTDQDSAFVDVVAPNIQIEKTVTTGGFCPGVDSLAVESGTGVTYCYAVTNTGDTHLSDIDVTDDVLGAVCSIPGPLAPGATDGCMTTTLITVDVPNVGTATGNPTDELGNDLPGIPNPSDQDGAAVDVVAPTIQVEKTVYDGHDGGASCPGGELVTDFAGSAVTYCFEVTNTGDTYLDPVTLQDLDLGITEAQMALQAGASFPLAPGATAVWYYETTIAGDLTNTVTSRGNPSDDQGNDLPGITNPTDDDTAEVEALAPGTPGIRVVKSADPTTAYPGTTVTYTYAVDNPGTTVLTNVSVSDDRCAPVQGPDPSGDANNNGLLDPGETWIYTCSAALSADTTNTALVTATPSDDQGDPIPGLPPVDDSDSETVDVINPGIALIKRAIPERVLPGDPVRYFFVVSNPGDAPLANVAVSDNACGPVTGPQPGDDANANGLLDPGETWFYECATTLAQDTLNVATATGEDSLGGPVEDEDEAFVDVVIVGLDIEKQADATTVYSGTVVSYTYTVRNTGTEPASNVQVSDDRCAGVGGPAPGGDANTNGLLDPGEVWIYTCSQALVEDTLNTATASGEDPLGNPVDPDQAVEDVNVIHPAIRVEKSASPEVVLAGGSVSYGYVVTNPGDDPLSSVALVDDTCGPISGPQAGGDANANGLLDPGETWLYSCADALLVDTTNTVVASAEDSLGGPVQDQDSAFVDVVAPSVLVEKDASAPIVYVGELVTYSISATNTGDVALEPVAVSDDLCSPLTGPDPAGDPNANGLLDPGETWVYSCSQNLDVDRVNTASATFNPVDDDGDDLPGLPNVGDEDSAEVDVIDPSVRLDKSVDPSVIAPGDEVTYTFELTNTGDDPLSNVSLSDDTCSPVIGPEPGGDANNNGFLDPGETWVYTCSSTLTEDTVNVATGGGDDSLGNPVTDTDSALVDALDVELTLEKSVDRTIVDVGDVVTYTYLAGNIGGAPADNVSVTDDRCAPVVGPEPGGDANTNGLLDPGETWVYTCSSVLNEDTVNVATLSGEDQLGNPQQSDMDLAEVDVIDPAIRVVKSADPVVTTAGGSVSYAYEVTNPGDDPLSNVGVSDDTCGPLTGPDPAGDVNNNGLLDPGETWVYGCVATISSDTLNTATASGLDSLGRPVEDQDTAFVDVVAPALRVEKTVSTGGACPGTDSLFVTPGTTVSYCYAISNVGDTFVSEIIVADDVLGPVCAISGPLAPGATQLCTVNAVIDADVTNVATVSGNPTDPNGGDLPGIPEPEDDDGATVTVVLPSVVLEKTVYSGHDGGASCPGANLLLGVAGEDLTWCFAVTNSGDTHLASPQILDLDLGIGQAQLTLRSGNLPLAPGATATWTYEGSLVQSLVNTASVRANPSDPAGNDLPGLPDVADDDSAEVRRTSTLGDRIFYDLDNDGLFEPGAGEIGFDNVLVNLYRDDGVVPGELDAGDTALGSVLTAGGGYYEFRLLADGDYIVQVDPSNFGPGGALPLAVSSFGGGPPSDPDDDVDDDDNGEADALGGVSTAAVTIGIGTEPVSEDGDPDTNLTVDLGFIGSGSIGDQVWLDEDGNGQPDPGEGIPGVTVQLSGTINGVPFFYTTTTDADGNYLFENLLGGTYRVTVLTSTLPPGLEPVYDMDGVQTPNTALVQLLSGEVTLLADFGYEVSTLGGGSRAKLFYDPADGDDLYVNQRGPDSLPTLRLYGQTAVCDPLTPGLGNLPVTAGSNAAMDGATQLVPEDPPYSDPEGPFSPLSSESPEADYVTWNPAWISERLGDPSLMAGWGCANGLDEVSAYSNIRAGGVNASQKVWLRSWYEPTHLDKDLNADSCLTDNSGAPGGGPDGIPDAPMNPTPTSIDEWYPAIMTELTYMLVENAPLPQSDPAAAQLHRSAPRPTCGAPGAGTRIVFPVGTDLAATDDAGPAVGYGLTSLDVDFDGAKDMITVADEQTLPAAIGGTTIDFDGDGVVDRLDGDRAAGIGALSCDELAVLHTDAVTIGLGDTAQFLDHFVRVAAVTNSGAVLEIVYSGDLQTRPFNPLLVGNGATALAGDIGPAQLIAPGADNLGQVPAGPWFVHVVDSDPDTDTAIVVLGRGLGAPCASMEDGPNQANLRPGSPYFLKRFYVDGHEYNVTAIMTCATGGFQYMTLRAPLPKVPVIIEQHSVRLQSYGPVDRLVLPPPFNHEHTILEDVATLDDFGACPILPSDGQSVDRPDILYFGGPIGPVPPILSNADTLPYTGRAPDASVGPYSESLASSWFYVLEDVNPGLAGQLREKYGARRSSAPECPVPLGVPEAFFYNEQVLAAPYSFTEFHMPQLDDPVDPGSGLVSCDPDSYYVTSNLVDPSARQRQWRMPSAGVPAQVPPNPPDLIADYSGFDPMTGQYGAPRRASFEFDPDQPEKLVAGSDGVRLYGGFADCPDEDCAGAGSRPSILNGAGDVTALTDPVTGAPVEVLPYSDPFAPFNPQHPDAPRSDSLTFNPAFLSEFQHSGEALARLYSQIANNGQNALQKVYHRMWYQPDYITKLRFADDCARDIVFPALVQEYSFLPLDTTVNPLAMSPGTSQLAFPMATRAEELPLPGTNPAGSAFGYGLTTFDADFDGAPEAVKIHNEATLNAYLDTAWQSARPTIPGFPPAPVPGPELDFDGDGTSDDALDEDCIALNGNEMVVLALESIVLDADAGTTAIGQDVMFLDHMARVTNVTGGSFPRAQFEIRYTGGGPSDARPQPVPGGVISLDVGDAIVVDHLGGGLRRVGPGEDNLGGVDGAWFLFVEDVASGGDVVVVTVGRALGASHSAIDDGFGNHDLAPGDPWYLKRFYVDGHEYNVVALMTQSAPGADPLDPAECNTDFGFLTIRTPVPKGRLTGDQFNNQDSLFQQGYFLDGLPAQMSVMPPFNVDHTIAVDIERIDPAGFDDPDSFVQCTGPIRPAGPLTETITAEEREPRRAVELRETYSISRTLGTTPAWETHQSIAAAAGFTEIALPEDQTYLLTMQWRGRDSRLSFYGCTRLDGGPYDEDNPPPLSQDDLRAVADCWRTGIVPENTDRPAPYVGTRVGGDFGSLPGPGGPQVPPPPTPTGADLRLEKTALTQTPVAGTQFAYLIEVFNDGPDTAASFTVTDTLPAGLSYASDTTGGACSLESTLPDTLRCEFDDLLAGDSELFAVLAFVDPGVPPGTPLINTASVTLESTSFLAALAGEASDGAPMRALAAADPDPGNNADSTTVFVVAESDLGLSSLATVPEPVVAGEVFTGTFRVGNAGPSDAPGLRMTLEIPAGTSYAGSQGMTCSGVPMGATGMLSCQDEALPLGEETVFDIALRVDPSVDPGTRVGMLPSISAPGATDPNADDDLARGETTTIAEADLSVEKLGPAAVRPGERFDFTITLRNAGPSDARGVTLIERLPPELTLVDSHGLACIEDAQGALRCDLGSLEAGSRRDLRLTVELSVEAPEAGRLGGSTEVVSDTPDRGEDDNQAPDIDIRVLRQADLAPSVVPQGVASAGAELDWQIRVHNAGPTGASEVRIDTRLPEGLGFVDGDASCVETSPGSGQLTCELGGIEAGATRMVALRTLVDPNLADGHRLELVAIASAGSSDPNPDNDTTRTTIVVKRHADLVTGLELSSGSAVAGEALRYVMTLENRGPSEAEGVRWTSRLPAGTRYRSDDGACAMEGDNLVCMVGELPAGGPPLRTEVTLDVDAALAPGTVLGLRSASSTQTRELQPANNSAVLAVEVGALADLRYASAPLERSELAGTSFEHLHRVANAGPSMAPAVVLTAALPEGLTAGALPAGCLLEASMLRCDLGDLAPDATVELALDLALDAGLDEGAVLESQIELRSAVVDPSPANASATQRVLVTRQADLGLVMDGPESIEPGGEITYRLSLANAGPSDAADVRLVDRLPAGFAYKWSIPAACSEAEGLVECALGDLPAGETEEIEIVGTASASLPEGSSLTNEAELSAATLDPNDADDRDAWTTILRLADEADLAMALVASESQPAAGSELLLRAALTNRGPRPAPNAALVLRLPAELSLAGAVEGCAVAEAGLLRCEQGSLGVGATVLRELPVEVAADVPEGRLLLVEAEATSERADPIASNDRATVELTATRWADLALQLAAEPAGDRFVAGAELQFGLAVENRGPSPSEPAELTLTLPTHVQYLSDDGGCDSSDLPRLRCTLPASSPGGSRAIRVDAALAPKASQGASLVASAEVSGAGDPESDNDRADIVIDVERRADLRLSKSASHSLRLPGEPVSYTLRVENLGPSDASAVRLVDRLPEGLIYLGDDAGCESGELPTLGCSLGHIAAGASVELQIRAEIAEQQLPGVVSNAAEVRSDTVDPVAGNDAASADVTIDSMIDLVLSLGAVGERLQAGETPIYQAVAGAVTAGRTLTYRVELRNDGPADASGIRLRLRLPEGLTLLEDGEDRCETTALPELLCELDALAAGETSEIELVTRAEAQLTEGASLVVEAEVEAVEAEANRDDNRARQVTLVEARSDLAVSLSASPDRLLPGDPLSLVAEYEQPGPSMARDLRLLFEIPPSFDLADEPDGCSLAPDGRLACLLGDLMPGATGRLELNARADLDASVGAGIAAVTIESMTIDPVPSNDRAEARLAVGAAADLGLVVAALGESLEAGDPPRTIEISDRVAAGMRLHYRLRLSNAGPSPAEDPRLTLQLPAGLRLLELPMGCDSSALPDLVCALDALAAGASRDVDLLAEVAAEVEPGSSLSMTAQLTSGAVDPQADDNAVEHRARVEAWADLAIGAELDPSFVRSGEVVSLTVTAANVGPSVASETAIIVSLPAGLEMNSAPEGCAMMGGSETAWRCAVDRLMPGATLGRLFFVAVSTDREGEIELAVAIASSTGDPRVSNNATRAGLLIGRTAPPLEPTPTPGTVAPTPDPRSDRSTIFLPVVKLQD